MLLDKIPVKSVFTDSCNFAAGGFFEGDWFYCNWECDWPLVSKLHINEKEIITVFQAVWRWAPCWQNKRVYIQSDNICTVHTINLCTSRNHLLMACLRVLFWLSATVNFHITAQLIPGLTNTLADRILGLHEPKKLTEVTPFVLPSRLDCHMSQASLFYLFSRP